MTRPDLLSDAPRRFRPAALANGSRSSLPVFGHRHSGIPGKACVPRAGLEPAPRGNPSKSRLCRGPDLNRRHMVLQVTSPAIREMAPRMARDETWLWPTTYGSNADRPQRVSEKGPDSGDANVLPDLVGRACPLTEEGHASAMWVGTSEVWRVQRWSAKVTPRA
jgi:hypothetical protein